MVQNTPSIPKELTHSPECFLPFFVSASSHRVYRINGDPQRVRARQSMVLESWKLGERWREGTYRTDIRKLSRVSFWRFSRVSYSHINICKHHLLKNETARSGSVQYIPACSLCPVPVNSTLEFTRSVVYSNTQPFLNPLPLSRARLPSLKFHSASSQAGQQSCRALSPWFYLPFPFYYLKFPFLLYIPYLRPLSLSLLHSKKSI